MKKVVITSYARTPIGAFLGGLKTVPVEELASMAIKEALKRSSLESDQIDEVICAHVISSADCGNIARVAALKAGLAEDTPGYTINRICASGIQAVASAAMQIMTGNAETVMVAGAESLSRVPYYLPLQARYEGFRVNNSLLKCANEEHAVYCQPADQYPGISSMGITAENVVEKTGISRVDQEAYAFRSQQRTSAAVERGRLAEEIFPVEIKLRKETLIVEKDEHPRPGTSPEALAKLRPCFKPESEGGTVTAGTSSGLNDGGAAIVVMSEEKCLAMGLKPLAYVEEFSAHAVNPYYMGLGPVGAIEKLLQKTGLSFDDIDILEINEAFAGQVLGCMKELGQYMDSPLYERLNPNGGAIALGHPLGMTGVRIVGSCAFEFKHNTAAKYAIASACIGGGQGFALLLRNPNK